MIRIDQKAVLDAKTVTKNERKILQNLPVLGDYSKRKTNCKLSEALGRLMALVSKHRRGLEAAVGSKPQLKVAGVGLDTDTKTEICRSLEETF